MKIYKTQKEVEKDIKHSVLVIDDNVKFECDISIKASIFAGNINARDIIALDINAGNIIARNINAWDITAEDIDAWDIDAEDIDAEDINAWNIDAEDIFYHAFCCSYSSIKCKSIKGRRGNHYKPICLDGKLEMIEESKNPKEIVIDGATYILQENE